MEVTMSNLYCKAMVDSPQCASCTAAIAYACVPADPADSERPYCFDAAEAE